MKNKLLPILVVSVVILTSILIYNWTSTNSFIGRSTTIKKDSKNQLAFNSFVKEMKDVKMTDEKIFIYKLEGDDKVIEEFKGKKYVDHEIFDGYAKNLHVLLGTSLQIKDDSIIVDVGEFQYIKDSIDNYYDTTKPENGKMKQHMYVKKKNKTRRLFFINFNVKENQAVQYSLNEIERHTLKRHLIDYQKINKGFSESDDDIDEWYIIRTAYYVELIQKTFTEEDKGRKLKSLPNGSTVVSFEDSFYQSTSTYDKEYLVAIGYTKVKTLLRDSRHLLKKD